MDVSEDKLRCCHLRFVVLGCYAWKKSRQSEMRDISYVLHILCFLSLLLGKALLL